MEGRQPAAAELHLAAAGAAVAGAGAAGAGAAAIERPARQPRPPERAARAAASRLEATPTATTSAASAARVSSRRMEMRTADGLDRRQHGGSLQQQRLHRRQRRTVRAAGSGKLFHRQRLRPRLLRPGCLQLRRLDRRAVAARDERLPDRRGGPGARRVRAAGPSLQLPGTSLLHPPMRRRHVRLRADLRQRRDALQRRMRGHVGRYKQLRQLRQRLPQRSGLHQRRSAAPAPQVARATAAAAPTTSVPAPISASRRASATTAAAL